MSRAPAEHHASSAPAERWLADHGGVLYGYAMRRVRDPFVAEDLVQETLLAAIRSVSGYAGIASERTWLIGILKHKLIDHLRESLRREPMTELQAGGESKLFDKSGHWMLRVSKWNADPSQRAQDAEFQAVLDSCLSKLPPRLAQVFWLHEAESVSSKQLCKELDISQTNLWTMLHKARLRLQRCLTINWFESRGK